MDIDPDLKAAEWIAACHRWQEDYPRDEEKLGFRFIEATSTSLNFTANAMLFQLIIPASLIEHGDVVSGDVFIALSPDNSAPQTLVDILNEKLERVNVGQLALALDLFSKTVNSFRGKRRRTESDAEYKEPPNNVGVAMSLDDLDISDGVANDLYWKSDQEDEYEDEYEAEDEDGGPREDEDEGHDFGNAEPDCSLENYFKSHDLGETLTEGQYDVGKTSRDTVQNSGYLQVLARRAKENCEAAQARDTICFLSRSAGNRPSLSCSSSPPAPVYDRDILQHCNVSTIPQCSCVEIQADVSGIVSDVMIATALGLSVDRRVYVFLQFDKEVWSESWCLSRPLRVRRVTVKLESSRPTKGGGVANVDVSTDVVKKSGFEDVDFHIDGVKKPGIKEVHLDANGVKKSGAKEVDVDTYGKKVLAEEFDEEWKKRQTLQKENNQAYGVKVLLPELCKVFFECWSGVPEHHRSKTWKNKPLDDALRRFTEMENPIIGLVCFIGTQLRALPGWCAICWSELPSYSVCTRLRTCRNDLCLYEFEELGLGPTIYHEIEESPEVVDFELSLACAAATQNRDVFEPFPAFLLSGEELRARSGWFSKPSRQAAGGVMADRTTVTAKTTGKENKDLTLLRQTLQSIPSMQDLKGCPDEDSLRRKLAEAAFASWKETNPGDPIGKFNLKQMRLSYDLMRFILSTNWLSLRVLKEKDKLFQIKLMNQFVVLHESPEKEAIFEQKRSLSGSFFAFHGSVQCNWYSILRNGLRSMSNTHFMSTGAAHGHGIYLADEFSMSHQYAMLQSSCVPWKNGIMKEGMVVVAICEVLGEKTNQQNGIHVIPRDREDHVSLRYLLVTNTNAAYTGKPNLVILKGSTLRIDNHQPIELSRHYETLRMNELDEQTKILRKHRMESFNRAKENSADRQSGYDLASPSTLRVPASRAASLKQMVKGKIDSLLSRPPAKNIAVARDSLESRLTDTNTKGPTVAATQAKNIAVARGSLASRLTDTNTKGSTLAATQAISKEFKNLQSEIRKAKGEGSSFQGRQTDSFLSDITVDIPNETDLYTWNVALHQNLFKSSPKLYKDMIELATLNPKPESSVLLEVTFSGLYPFEPPFIRVVRPRFVFRTGHVTVGGSICMELLTLTGWLPTFSFENVLVQIVHAFIEGEGRIDRKVLGQEYSRKEAQEAFSRVAGQHQWKVGGSHR